MSNAETAADRAYAEAERMIAEARADGATFLDFDDDATHALETLPPEIATLAALETLDLDNTQVFDLGPLSGLTSLTELRLNQTQVSDLGPLSGLTSLTLLRLEGTQVSDLGPLSGLTSLTGLWLNRIQVSDLGPLSGLTSLTGLWLSGTQVSDLGLLSGLTSLTMLVLNGTQVSDLRPLRGLRRLVDDPSPIGLTFRRCAATRLDAEIARISKIGNSSERARALFDYLEDWVPPGEVATPAPNARTEVLASRAEKTDAFHVSLASTREIKEVLRESYPDLRNRSSQLVSLIQQQRSAFALIPRPNSDEALAEYLAEDVFLQTMEAGLVSIHEDMPDMPVGEISDKDAADLKAQLVELARLADRCRAYLDQDRGTYGGLWKIGLVTAVGGVISLIPGVSFVAGAAISGASLGAQTVRLEVTRQKDSPTGGE